MDLLFIFNPATGGGRIKSNLMEILCAFAQAGYRLHVCPTAGPGDARRLAAERGEGMDLVVCCGGDGTLSEVVDGLMTLEVMPQVGYLPGGTTCDFAASLHLPRQRLLAATRRVLRPAKVYQCDVGMFGPRAFTYVAAFGAFTQVSYKTPQAQKNMLGHLAYLLGGIPQLSHLSTVRMRVECEAGTYEDDYLLGMVSNSASVAGFNYPGKSRVRLDDGLFEILLVRMPHNIAQLGELSAAFLGGGADSPLLTVLQTRRARFTSEVPLPWTLDGEYGGEQEQVEITVRRRALPIRI